MENLHTPQNNKYYLYIHYKLDTNEPFYIGVGTKNLKGVSYTAIHKRAFSKNRSIWWKKTVNKHGYYVTIKEYFAEVEACRNREIELIAAYGRLDMGLGPLVNMSKGGDGCLDEEIRQRIGKKLSGLNNFKSKGCYQYDMNYNCIAVYGSFNMAANETGFKKQNLLSSKDKRLYSNGFYWYNALLNKEDLKNLIISRKVAYIHKGRKIYQIDINTGNIIKSYNRIVDAQKELSTSLSQAIKRCLLGYTKTAYGFKWEYAN